MALYHPAITWSRASEICKIPRTETRDGVTVYVIEISVSPFTWFVKHRYSDFSDLHEKLIESHHVDKNLLPPKKLFGSHSESFVLKRQTELELYLHTLLHRFNVLPLPLRKFLDFHQYEIRTVIENLCEMFYNQGDALLTSDTPYQFTPFELHAINERLKLAEPTCTTGEKKRDLGHLLSFITQLRHLKIVGSNSNVGTSNIIPNNLTFTLMPFKSLQTLEVVHCKLEDTLQTTEPLHKTLTHLTVHDTLRNLSSIILAGNMHWHPQDPVNQWPFWQYVTTLDLSHNSLNCIHPCVKLLPVVESIDLSYNNIQEIENLESLPRLSVLNLSHNKIQHLTALHTRLGNICTLIFSGNMIDCLQGLSRLFSLVELQLSDNCIASLSEIAYIGKLPCLEKLNLSNNPISNSVDYRAHVLLAFSSRAAEIILDGVKTSEKEVDTVAVLQALQVAKKEQFSQDNYQKICPEDKTMAVHHHTCSEFKRFQRLWGRSSAVSKFRQEVATLRKLGGSNWLRLLNQILSKTTQEKLPSTETEIPEQSVPSSMYHCKKQKDDDDHELFYKMPYPYASVAFPEWMLTPSMSIEVLKEYLQSFVGDDALEILSLQSLSSFIDFLWLIYVVHQCISVAQVPVCVLLFSSQIVVFKIESLMDGYSVEKSTKLFPFLPKMSYFKAFSLSNVSSLMIGPRKSYIELHVGSAIGVQKHLFFVPNSSVADKYIEKFQQVYDLLPSFKRNPFVQEVLDLEVLRSDQSIIFSTVQCQLLYCERVILLEASYCCSFDSIHYVTITPSHIILVEEMLPFVLHPEFHACTVINIHTNVQSIHVGHEDSSVTNNDCNCNETDVAETTSCANSNDTLSFKAFKVTEVCGPCVFVEFASNVVINIRFLCFEDQSKFLDSFLHARSM